MLTAGHPKKIDIASTLLRTVRQRKSLSEIVSVEIYGKPYVAKKADGS